MAESMADTLIHGRYNDDRAILAVGCFTGGA
jgi:hypothetical protein